MSKEVTVVMYHYVRDLKHSRYSEIKGLDIRLFKEQLEYILKHYNVITMEDLMDAIEIKKELPDNALLLTFDDAYIDHYLNVFPILNEKGVQGTFFPPVKAITKHEVLDVNKVHFILASVENKQMLINEIFSMMDKYRNCYTLKDNKYYYDKYAKNNRFDTKEVVFIKRILQGGLPEELRNEICNCLFRKYVSENESAFSRELYMNTDQLRCIKQNGMFIGVHGYDHYWLSTLNREQQINEIELSIKFLKEIGVNTDRWAMCYPYGDYDKKLLKVIKDRGCTIGFTTEVAVANTEKDSSLTLPRLDTNDLPKDRNDEFRVIM